LKFKIFLSLLLLILSPLIIFHHPVYAASIVVNTTDDELNSDGDCSLREALQSANTDTVVDACAAGSGTDTVSIPAGIYTLSIAGTGEDANATGDLDITSNLTINGAGLATTIIDGGGIDRVIEVHPGATVQINNVTVQNGNRSGVLNRGILTINNSTVTNNSIATFGGGGIYNVATGTLTVNDSTVSNNNATSPDLSHGGGGIYSDSGGPVTINRTTISGNTTTGRGGGILGQDPTINIINSTISGNTALNGGGIFNRFGTVNFNNTTIADNVAADNGGGVWNFGGALNYKNTILSSNNAATPADNCAGGITSQGYNISSDASCAFGGIGDLNSTNPMLGPLANNGGPTLTHALLLGSPAINGVPLISCTVSTDQRGVNRPTGAACDIGAYEYGILVAIDIKPGSFPNAINTKSKGKIPVAILSTNTFNAPSELDKTSLTFGKTGGELSLAFCNKSGEDVNSDGFPDQVCHFYTQMTGFQLNDTLGILKGQTVGSVPINASDSVKIVN
jgi:CSLREA domain-containing protein